MQFKVAVGEPVKIVVAQSSSINTIVETGFVYRTCGATVLVLGATQKVTEFIFDLLESSLLEYVFKALLF